MSLVSISSKIAEYVTKETELGLDQTDNVRYGLEIILGALIKGIILLTTACFLSILPQVVIALACGSLLRLVSGGAHCTSYLRCLICGLIIYLSAGKIALNLEKLLNPGQLAVILLPCFLAILLCACLWAPAEVPYRKLSYKEATFFKSLTIVFLIVSFTAALLFANYIRLSFILAGLLALLVQTFSFTPWGYFTIDKIDGFLFWITRKQERRCVGKC
jgi:accessory gene regulator B